MSRKAGVGLGSRWFWFFIRTNGLVITKLIWCEESASASIAVVNAGIDGFFLHSFKSFLIL